MKILFLTQIFPLPLDSGGKIKTFYTIKALAGKHDVRVLTYVRNEQERGLVEELAKVCSGVDIVPLTRGKLKQASDLALSLGLGRSFIISRDYRQGMQEAYKRLAAHYQPDIIHIDHLQMAQFVDFHDGHRIVLDHHNVESMIVKRIGKTAKSPLMRMYARVEWPKLQQYELQVCRNCDAVLTVSDEDKKTLQELDSGLINIACVPIGVDTDYFQPVERNIQSLNILSIGTMYWPPNVDSILYFHREIYPMVKQQIPGAMLTIAGQRPTPAITALDNRSDVLVTGYVKDDRETAKECGVFIVPLRSGSGVRVKILNAMAMGLPIVSTSVGAEGLEVTDGEHLLIADTTPEFANAVTRVLKDKELALRLGNNGRRLVCEKYSWKAIGDRLLRVYETI